MRRNNWDNMPVEYYRHMQECAKYDHIAPDKREKPKKDIKIITCDNRDLINSSHKVSINKTNQNSRATLSYNSHNNWDGREEELLRIISVGWVHRKTFIYKETSYLGRKKELSSVRRKHSRKRSSSKMREYRKTIQLCEVCQNSKPEHTHHRVPVELGGIEKEENYLAVCMPCHGRLHPELPEGVKKQWFKGLPKEWHK